MDSMSKMTLGGGGKSRAGLKADKKSAFLDLTALEEANKRENKDFGLFENYQVNPFNKDAFDFVTPKIGERPPKIDPKTIPGYWAIREAVSKSSPILNDARADRDGRPIVYCEPRTTNGRYGWFYRTKMALGAFGHDASDERFMFSHRTADFIKTKARIKAYDHMMGNQTSSSKPNAPPK